MPKRKGGKEKWSCRETEPGGARKRRDQVPFQGSVMKFLMETRSGGTISLARVGAADGRVP